MTIIHHYHFAQLASTQSYLLEHPACEAVIFCRAQSQSAGQGQRGAVWQSPVGGLYFSVRYPLKGGAALHGGLAQALALCIAETIDPQAVNIRLKWPNDLFLGEKKLGGILIDMLADAAVIGIGINISGEAEQIAYYQQYQASISADSLYQQLQNPLLSALAQWAQKPYLPTSHRWQDYDRFHAQSIYLENRAQAVKNLGIDQKGRLMVAGENGIEYLSSTRICV